MCWQATQYAGDVTLPASQTQIQGQTQGAHREAVWTALMRARACSYPLPPHGHHPNFTNARKAAQELLKHPQVQGLGVLVVGADRVLYPLRKLALAAGMVLYVPNQKKESAGGEVWYWELRDPAGAKLSAMPRVGEPKLRPQGVQGVVLACVAVDSAGARLSKGFGWGARGLHLAGQDGIGTVPQFTLAHPMMICPALPCAADSQVTLIATPTGVIESGLGPRPVVGTVNP